MIRCSAEFRKTHFPCGEIGIALTKVPGHGMAADVDWEFESCDEIVTLLLMCDALRSNGYFLGKLNMPYVPFGRQDRACNPGEAFSLRTFAQIINGLGFNKVCVTDPHSDVTPALLDRCVVTEQHELFHWRLEQLEPRSYWLVSPDAGALKKIYKLARKCAPLGVIECSKERNLLTGEIHGVRVPDANIDGKDCVIVDDICDGGATFVAIAKRLREMASGKIKLFVTHGFFTKGLGVFDGLIDEVWTRKGRIK